MTPLEFVTQVYPVAASRVEGHKPCCMVVTHAALESGWGKSQAFQHGNNPFNITRLPTDKRAVIMSGDLEYSQDGNSVRRITQRFAWYPSLEAAVSDYLSFISKARYQPAPACLATGDVGGFVAALKNGGYFTSPLSEYLAGFAATLDHVTLMLANNVPNNSQ